jgi:hypothetical protein
VERGLRGREDRRVYAAVAIAALIAASCLVLVAVLSGSDDGAERITFSDFGAGLLGLGEIDERNFFATCSPGRLSVDFTPDQSTRIKRGDELIASLTAEEAFVGCPGVLEDRRGWGFYVRGLNRLVRPTTLECVTELPVELVVSPIFRDETNIDGGSVILGTPVKNQLPKAIIISTFREDDPPDVLYRAPTCKISKAD